MNTPSRTTLLAVIALLALAVVVLQPTLLGGILAPSPPDDYERATVDLRDTGGTTLATVEVRVADTQRTRYVGLSATDSLAQDEGMLFVHDEEGEYAYVMRRMAFPLDILFVAENGTITAIHHASTESRLPWERLTRYPGRGTYVLEVNRGFANRTGVEVGDTIAVPPGVG
jgi:Uncharacterized conserved protein